MNNIVLLRTGGVYCTWYNNIIGKPTRHPGTWRFLTILLLLRKAAEREVSTRTTRSNPAPSCGLRRTRTVQLEAVTYSLPTVKDIYTTALGTLWRVDQFPLTPVERAEETPSSLSP